MRATVIVATRDRHDLLARCLEALGEQDLPPEAFEVVVVDDASLEPVSVPPALGPEGPRVRCVRRDTSGGPAGARNTAIAVAGSPVLAITDDDCRPERGWLRAGLAAIEAGHDLVAGRTIPDPAAARSRGPFSYTMDVPGPDPRYSTCNVFYRRDWVERLGGFSDAFYAASGHHLGEDADLAWRAIEAGARAGYAADAVVVHAVREQTFREYLRSRRRLEGIVPLVKRHPGVKRAYFTERFYSPTHAFVTLGLAGLALVPASSLALLAWAPYLVWRSRAKRALLVSPLRFLRRNRHLPLWTVIDVYEVAIFLRASLRHRHLYL